MQKKSVSKVHSFTEWGVLEEVVVGIATNAKYPANDFALNVNIASDDGQLPDLDVKTPSITPQIIEETNEDLEIFVGELRKLGIIVKRPQEMNPDQIIQTPFWQSSSYFNYCPRDTFFTIGENLIESPNFYRSRYFETFSYRELFLEYFESGCKWYSAPKPRLRETDFSLDQNSEIILKESDIMFDAANILKAGKDIFYLVSNSGNMLGCKWLQSVLGEEFRVHPLQNIYKGTHVDTTLVLLKPGLVLANPKRVNLENLPDILKKWKIIFTPAMVEYTYSDIPPFTSKWLGMNLLMLRPDLAAVDSHQKELVALLKEHGIESLPINLRHSRLLDGGLHCTTLDIRRQDYLEDFF